MNNLEESLREAACMGDAVTVKKLIVDKGVSPNCQNKMNGWTALHWAAKRGHRRVADILLEHGAKKDIKNMDGHMPYQLTSAQLLKEILRFEETSERLEAIVSSSLPVEPHYLKYPEFPYLGKVEVTESQKNSIQEEIPLTASEFVVKARIQGEHDFIEVDLPGIADLTFKRFCSIIFQELDVDPADVAKIRKLPNTLIRNDKDISRITNYQEVEVVTGAI